MPASPLVRIRRAVRKTAKALPHEWRAYLQQLPIDPDLVVYESFAGNGMLCNPEAIFRELLADPAQHHLRHVWVLADLNAYASTVNEFKGDHRVRFVRRGSMAYDRALATAGLLVNNATFPPRWGKRPGQTYLNTWHGTPLKKMGYDEAQGAYGARNVLRNFLMADYLLSSGEFMSERMYESAYRLVNVAEGKLLELGYPRTDHQFADDERRGVTRDRLNASGAHLLPDERLVLLAPTWKGESFHSPRNDAAALADVVAELERRLPSGFRVLLKVHQQVYAHALREPRLAGRLVPNDVPTNAVLALTDVLVTDYSSIFFDFLSTEKPIVFFTPDREDYDGYRGAYLEVEELPGPQVTDVEALAATVAAVGSGGQLDPARTHRGAQEAARRRFAARDDGQAARRVVDVVVRGQASVRGVRDVARDGRRTLLVYLGGMMSNGITSSALNLLRTVDHDRWDVTAIVQQSKLPERQHNIGMIDPRVRVLYRKGGMEATKRLRGARRKLMRGHDAQLSPTTTQRLSAHLAQEARRNLGDARFDHVVDFSGYSPQWTFMLGAAAAGQHSVWQHNDLLSDQMRQVGGRRPHEHNLAGVFRSYRLFDHLVSVSEALRDINAHSLKSYAPPTKFVAARNTIDIERVTSSAAETAPEGTLDALVPTADGAEPFVFVTVGRLSPEKNHQRLIDAFAAAHASDARARLVIVGDGPLRAGLEAQVRRLGLQGVVRLVGQQRNPWSIMARCSCFVLSSDYEGQPMVILEARTLGLPVVSTAFASVRSALSEGEGLIVDPSVEALAAGMKSAIRGEVPAPQFEAEAYNRTAMDEFAVAIGATHETSMGRPA